MTITTPDWVKNAVFYQIFPDRFARSKMPQAGLWESSRLEPWNSEPTYNGYKGGDLWGAIDSLEYLKNLGVNAIYLTPIFQSASNHRYHTHDYYQVDPMLGGNVAFDAFLEAAHRYDIRVVLDGVFNHASRGFFFFNDILENGSDSPWLDWFRVENWPLSAYDGTKPANYISWVGNRALPQFNHDNPQVKEYIMQVAEYWLKKGIDGWRLDVPNEVETPGFWQEFRDRVKAVNPEAYIVGEIWTDATQWLDGTQFDGVMNYRFAEPTIALVSGDRYDPEYAEYHYKPYPAIDAQQYKTEIKQLLDLYDWEIQQTQLNLLNSHDTSRLLSAVGGDRGTINLATTLLFTFPGAPCIYYGDEVGLPGGRDPDCRRGFPLEGDWDLETLKHYQTLINLRHEHPALRTGSYEVLYAEDRVYSFARVLNSQAIIVAVNASDSAAEISFLTPNLLDQPRDLLYGDGNVSWQDNRLELTIAPRNFIIIGKSA